MGGCNAGDVFIGNASKPQLFGLFASATKDQRIASFEPCNTVPLGREAYEEGIDAFLWNLVAFGLFADINQAGAFGHEGHDFRRHKAIIDHHIGGIESFDRFDGQQIGIARTRADEEDFALGEIFSWLWLSLAISEREEGAGRVNPFPRGGVSKRRHECCRR